MTDEANQEINNDVDNDVNKAAGNGVTRSALGRYMVDYLNAQTDLERAKTRLQRNANDLRVDEDERFEAAAGALDIADELARLKSAHAAFLAEQGAGAAAPPAGTLQKATELASAFGRVIARETMASALVDAVTALVNGWASLASTPRAAAAAPSQATHLGLLQDKPGRLPGMDGHGGAA